MKNTYRVELGDCRESLRRLAAEGVRAQTCVTSPPYFGLRDYGHDGQLGLEETPEQYIAAMVAVFREVRDVLADDGTLWVVIGDSYARNPSKGGSGPGGKNGAYSDSYTAANELRAPGRGVGQRAPQIKKRAAGDGIKEKDLIGIPWMLGLALRADGWYLRQDIIWSKPNPMPESVRDRFTRSHEYVLLLSKSSRYYFDHHAMKEPAVYADCGRPSKAKGEFQAKGEPMPGQLPFRAVTQTRNRRSVWNVATRSYRGAHFATFPPALIESCVLAGSRRGDLVLDPFGGSGTTAGVALARGRNAILCELNPDYAALVPDRVEDVMRELRRAPRVKRPPKASPEQLPLIR